MDIFIVLMFCISTVLIAGGLFILYMIKCQRQSDQYLLEAYELAERTANSKYHGETQRSIRLMSQEHQHKKAA